MFKKTALSLCFAIFIGLLCSCSPKNPLRLQKNESPKKNAKEIIENTVENEKIGTAVALPPAYNGNNALQNTQNINKPNGLHALKPSKGINVNQLFSKKIKSTDKRFDRVEDAVVDLRQEFETYKPSIVRLAAVESDIQNLIKELEGLLNETPHAPQSPAIPPQVNQSATNHMQTPIVTNNPVPLIQQHPLTPKATSTKQSTTHTAQPKKLPTKKTPAKTAKTPIKIKHYDHNVAQNLRIGEHAGKVRLVFDANHVVNHAIDLDNEENIIIVELPQAMWVGAKSKKFTSSKLIESYTVEPMHDGKGSMVILTLNKPTQIMTKHTLTPDKTSPYHRVYFDLKL